MGQTEEQKANLNKAAQSVFGEDEVSELTVDVEEGTEEENKAFEKAVLDGFKE